MISFAFYVAYTVGSLIYFGVSKWRGVDILNKLGYKNGICLGLLISALGTLLFYPAAETSSFTLMIMGGGVVSLVQGYLASDAYLGIQLSYIVGVACFAYLASFALRAQAILKREGIDYDTLAAEGH